MPRSFLILAFISTLAASPEVLFAGTVRIENNITSSVNTGNNSANGADGADGEDGSEGRDGRDGADGKNGTVIEGKSESSVSITTTVDGKVVEDFHKTVTEGKYATSSVYKSNTAEVTTKVEMEAGSDGAQASADTALEDSTSSRTDLGAAISSSTIALGTTAPATEARGGVTTFVRSIAAAITAFIHGLFGFEGQAG